MKSVLFGHMWKMSAAGIVINNPKIIDLFSYKFYVGTHKGGFGIVNYNLRRTYCPLVPKQYTFSATKGSPQIWNQNSNTVIYEKCCSYLSISIFTFGYRNSRLT